MGLMNNAAMAGYRIKTPMVETDARGALGMIKRLSYDEILKKKDVRKAVRQSLTPARKAVQQAARAALGSDPRKAYLGVKLLVYKRGNGGNISLLSQRGTGKTTTYARVKGGRSGIVRNRSRSRRTEQIDGYQGRDRAFILRFMNEGTAPRSAFTRERSKNGKTANRGALSGKNFFAVSDGAVEQSARTLAERMEKMIVEAGYGK